MLHDAGEMTRVIVAGDGPMKSDLQRLIEQLGVQEQVSLIGQQSRSSVTQLLNDCTLFVLPSRFESFGIAIVEAMACGKAVVGTTVDGILEIVDDWRNGILVEPGDVPALAAAIRLLLCDPTLRHRLGQAARARVKDHFQRRRMGESYAHAFQEVLADGL